MYPIKKILVASCPHACSEDIEARQSTQHQPCVSDPALPERQHALVYTAAVVAPVGLYCHVIVAKNQVVLL